MRVPGIPYSQGRNSYADADGTKYGIAIHNTSNTATAAAEASYATRRTDGISAHFYADGTQVIQSLDTNARAGHAGSSNGNQHAIAIEITGTNARNREWWLANVAWSKLGAVLAACCRQYGISVRRATVPEMKINPKVKAFYSHDDMRRAWGGTTHTDPGPHFPWDRLFDAVNTALNGGNDVTPAEIDAIATASKQKILADGGMQQLFARVEALSSGRDPDIRGGANVLHQRLVALGAGNADVQSALAAIDLELDTVGNVDESAIATQVLAGLTPAAIAAAVVDHLPAELAQQVVDEIHGRLAS